MKKLAYYILIPLSIVAAFIVILNYNFQNLEKSINLTGTLIQTLAIFIGGLWAYHKFDWEKKG